MSKRRWPYEVVIAGRQDLAGQVDQLLAWCEANLGDRGLGWDLRVEPQWHILIYVATPEDHAMVRLTWL